MTVANTHTHLSAANGLINEYRISIINGYRTIGYRNKFRPSIPFSLICDKQKYLLWKIFLFISREKYIYIPCETRTYRHERILLSHACANNDVDVHEDHGIRYLRLVKRFPEGVFASPMSLQYAGTRRYMRSHYHASACGLRDA